MTEAWKQRLVAAAAMSAAMATDLRAQSITIDLRSHVSAALPATDHAEPWVAVDPRHPRRAIAGAMVDSANGSVVYYTHDGGVSWKRSALADGGVFPGGDPVIAFTSGRALLATISPFRVWRSDDGGATWAGPSSVPGRAFDREFLLTDPFRGDTVFGIAKTTIKVVGHMANDALAVARSVDRGMTFGAPRLLLPDPVTSIVQVAGRPLWMPDGSLLIPFIGHRVPVTGEPLVQNRIWLLRVVRSGAVFEDPVPVVNTVSHGWSSNEMLMWKGIAGVQLELDTAVTSPLRGRLYLSYLTVHAGRLQVMLTASADTGRTWNAPVTVNDDRSMSNHSNPHISINAAGAIAVIWNDRSEDPSDLCFRARFTASIDGGKSFLPSVPVASEASCPVRSESPYDSRTFAGRFINGGETQGLAALPDGRFLAVFVAGQARMQLHSARIDVKAAVGR